MLFRYHQPHGEMHSTSTRASLSGCCSGVPGVWQPIWRLPQLPVVLVPVVLVPVVPILLVAVLRLVREQ
jgi:hypothetical protein